VRSILSAALLVTGVGLGAAAAAAQERQGEAAGRPLGEYVEVLRSAAVEGGRGAQQVRNARSVVPNPAYQAWRGWGVGTRVIARLDAIDAAGRNTPVQRFVLTLDALNGEAARVLSYRIDVAGDPAPPLPQTIPARMERARLLMARASPSMVYWRRYEARAAMRAPVPKAPSEPEAADQPDGRRRRARDRNANDRRRNASDAIPAEFDCAIMEIAHLNPGEDPNATDDPQQAGPGAPILLIRSYHSLDAPGWEFIVETYEGVLDANGMPASLELVTRWRIEHILRPGEPDPTLEQPREGLREG